MRLKTHLKTALRNLAASPLRSFLAMLGIMVGTASVVALVSGGSLATQQALEQFRSLGTDLMRIDFDQRTPSAEKATQTVEIEKLFAMRTSIQGVSQVVPIAILFTSGMYQKIILDSVVVVGSTESLADLVHITIKSGRFINDLDRGQYFCVLGSAVAKKLNFHNLLGSHLKFENTICTIIGIADPWAENNIVNANINNAIIIPLTTLMQVSQKALLNTAMLRIREDADIDTTKIAITDYFKRNLPEYNLNIQSSKEILNRIANQQTIFSLLLGLIGGISLLVGGIGVMNIMLASVAERHSEIGLRLALGAKPRDVQVMFLMEAATLAILGGSLGVILGIVATAVIAYFANWTFVIYFWPPLIGFGVSLLVSLFFGFYPAYIASQLNPIETLRA